jgi:hypothetical protein
MGLSLALDIGIHDRNPLSVRLLMLSSLNNVRANVKWWLQEQCIAQHQYYKEDDGRALNCPGQICHQWYIWWGTDRQMGWWSWVGMQTTSPYQKSRSKHHWLHMQYTMISTATVFLKLCNRDAFTWFPAATILIHLWEASRSNPPSNFEVAQSRKPQCQAKGGSFECSHRSNNRQL